MKKYIYICKTKTQLEKYEILIATEKLEKLKEIIIKQCGFIEKIEENETNIPNINDQLHIKNYIEEKIIDKITFKTTYKISYLKYNDPPLVILIDKILKEDLTCLSELQQYDKALPESYTETILQQLKTLKKR